MITLKLYKDIDAYICLFLSTIILGNDIVSYRKDSNNFTIIIKLSLDEEANKLAISSDGEMF